MSQKLKIFSAFGIEAEYMIVDKATLKVRPMADLIIRTLNKGKQVNEVELGDVSWSNELVNHVLEIKCTDPIPSIDKLDQIFHASIKNVNSILEEHNCILMPTAMHPFFDPLAETQLWPHDQREIYNLYNEIFDCKGHGWSNLQSVHINLPYSNEEEFRNLHSSIRAVLPLIPFLAASSPYFEGKSGALADNRLGFYEKNQIKIPSIIGNIIPEKVSSTTDYKKILSGIYNDISHYKNAKVLQNPWLNSRAAIPKFDVGAIEIRVMDIQESPYMDFCLIHFVVEMIKYISKNSDAFEQAENLSDSYLRSVYDESKKYKPSCDLSKYTQLFELKVVGSEIDFVKLTQGLFEKFKSGIPEYYHKGINTIVVQGNLSKRLTKTEISKDKYKKIINCLVENSIYE